MRLASTLLCLALAMLSEACAPAERRRELSATERPLMIIGADLPAGDVQRGRATFVYLRCHSCHRVRGVEQLPPPVADPPVPVVLGEKRMTDAEIITAIVNPSHEIAREYRAELVSSGRLSRMGDYSDLITVRQLVDLVAFVGLLQGDEEFPDSTAPQR